MIEKLQDMQIAIGAWIIVGGMLGVVAAMAIANLVKIRGEEISPGMTTEIAALVMFCAWTTLSHSIR